MLVLHAFIVMCWLGVLNGNRLQFLSDVLVGGEDARS
jgi:hypothetical protein